MPDEDVKQPPRSQKDPVPSSIRTHDFVERYGNNVRLESSAWDLKFIFGLLDQSNEPLVTNLHTSVNVPWMQAKLLAYLLYSNVLIHEQLQGPIQIPDKLVPHSLVKWYPQVVKDSPEMLARLERLRADLFGVEPVATVEDPPAKIEAKPQ